MAYTPRSWHDDPDPSTPVSAANLADLEQRLAAYTDAAVAGIIPGGLQLNPSGDATGLVDDTNMAAMIRALPHGGVISLLGDTTKPFYTAAGWDIPAQTTAGETGGGPVCLQGLGWPMLKPVGTAITGISYHRDSDYGSPAVANPPAGFIRGLIIDGSLALSRAGSNLVGNPSFEFDTDGATPADWPGTINTLACTLQTWQAQKAWSSHGSLAGRLTATITQTGGGYTKTLAEGTNALQATPNATYQIQATVNVVALVGDAKAVIGVRWYDAAGTTISTPTMPTTCYATQTGVHPLYGTITAPSNAAFVTVRIGFTSNSGTGQCDMYFDQAMFSKNATVQPYADGNTPGWRWTGTVGASQSTGAAASIGLDAGDGDGFDIDVICQNFTEGGIGAYLSNRLFATSHSTIKLRAYRNDTNVVFAFPGGTSFNHNKIDVDLRANANQAGVLVDGVAIRGGSLTIHGTMPPTAATSGTPTGNAAMLSLIHAGKVSGTRLEAHVEQGASDTGVGSVYPWALYSDGDGNVQTCAGYIDTDLNGSHMNGAECSLRGWYALGQAPDWPSSSWPGWNTRWYNRGPDAIVVVGAIGGTTSIGLNLVNTGLTSGSFPVKAGGSLKVNGTGTAPSWTVLPDGIIVEGSPEDPGTPSGVALFGNSLNAAPNAFSGCGGDTFDLCTAAAEDHLLFGAGSSTKMARQIMKAYLQAGNSTTGGGAELPATAADVRLVWPNLQAYLDQGGKVFISMKPSNGGDAGTMTFSTTNDNRFAACVDALVAVLGSSGANWKATFWQECNGARFGPTSATYPNPAFPKGASDYIAYVAHYAPIFRTHAPNVKLVYDPQVATGGGNNGSVGAVAYCPAAKYVDEVAVDYYCTSWMGKQYIDAVATMADQMSGGAVPFAVAEWGLRASTAVPTPTQWQQYIDYLTTLLAKRRAGGKKFGWMIYYGIGYAAGTPAANGNDNGWSVSNDFKLPGVLQLYNALGT